MVQSVGGNGVGSTVEVAETNFGDNDVLPFGDSDDAGISLNHREQSPPENHQNPESIRAHHH